MTVLSRRHLVVSGLAGAGASLLPGAINEANAATSIRYNLASANGQVMLKKYAQAVKLMMALPPSNPLSWTFQWYTHAVPTNTTKAAAAGLDLRAEPVAAKTLATAMWNTCQGHFAASGEPYFCPGTGCMSAPSRRSSARCCTIRSFTLPYWNYTSAGGLRRAEGIPHAERPAMGSAVPAEPQCDPPMPDSRSSRARGRRAISALRRRWRKTSYLPVGAVSGFNQTLDFGLHGNVHVFTGNSQGMGQVPWAANDPIFWMHHCNIDRIWASWNNAGHANPDHGGVAEQDLRVRRPRRQGRASGW